MPTYSVTAEVPAPDAEDVSAALFDSGASGVEVRDGSVAPMPGARRAAEGLAILVAWFPDRESAEEAAAELGPSAELALVPDQDWSETWKQGLAPFTVGRILVRPSWCARPEGHDGLEVVLDPGMAFGTGTHPTTALCLAALDQALAAHPGGGLLDVGTGSGLLAIAARKLGAGRVVATDNDPTALKVAAENAERNGVRLELSDRPPDALGGAFEVVVANILANTLVELAPGLAARIAPGGVLFLAGILVPQENEVRAAFLAQGLTRAAELEARQGEWSLLALRRPA
jgi:ribosomal protein L11 methyltransferase